MNPYNPYAPPPQQYPGMPPYYGQQPMAAYRELDALAIPKHGQLPNVCVKCSNPQAFAHPRKSFSFTPQWVWIVFLVSPLIGLIMSAVMRKSATFVVPLCQPCDAEWKKGNRNLVLSFIPGVAMFLLGVILCVVELDDVGGPLIGFSIFALILAPIIAQLAYRKKRTIWAKRIDDRYAVLAGIHPVAMDNAAMSSQGMMTPGQTVPMLPGQPQYVPPHMMR